MKKCNSCYQLKNLNDFCKDKTHPDGLSSICKKCRNEYFKNYYLIHKDRILDKQSNYHLLNQKRINLNHRLKYKLNKEQVKQRHRKYYETHKEQILIYRKKYENERLRTDLNFKIKKNLRIRINDALRGNNKSATTIKLLGCSVEQLKRHLELRFTEGMTWSNYGRNGWEIDHIIPCSSFDLTDYSQQRRCFHYSNLQPLWKLDNLKKGNRL